MLPHIGASVLCISQHWETSPFLALVTSYLGDFSLENAFQV